ncbi:MAG: class I SAM-dependent methyltransferase [Lachnospiraceae bacterium]|nr:class I SAM-dependent methyltransferase [Lachnospiraceae bacterium]
MKTRADKHDFKFDVRASVYDEQFEGKFSERVYRLVTETIELSPGDKILDVGCGTGTILRRLSDTCAIEGFGIDIEEKMIEQAKIKCPWMNIQKGDCSNMSFEDETFDSVIACMTFHHFYDQIAFAKEVSRVLKTGGKLYIADPAFPMLIRKAVNAIINRHELIGKFCGNKEIEQIFKPYNLVWKKKKGMAFFQLIVFEKVVERVGRKCLKI